MKVRRRRELTRARHEVEALRARLQAVVAELEAERAAHATHHPEEGRRDGV